MAGARITDPETSHDAAKSLRAEDLSETKQAILKILKYKDLNDDQIYQLFFQGAELGYWKHASVSGVRSRRAELVRDGLVSRKGKSETRFGRTCLIWGLA